MATIDDRQTQTNSETDDRGRRPGRVAGTARRRGHLRLSGRGQHADAPGADPLSRPDPDDPAPPRAGGHLRGRGLRPRHRQAGRRDGDLRARGAEPGHRPGRRQDGLASRWSRSPARSRRTSSAPTPSRKRRWSRSAGRSPSTTTWCRTPATSPGSSRKRSTSPAPAGPGPVLIDMPKDIQNTLVADPDYDVAMDLPGYRLPPPPSPEKIREVARRDRRRASGRSSTAAAASSRPNAARGAPRVRHQDRHPRRHDRARPGLDPQRPLPVARHARHARHGLRELRRSTRPTCCWPSASGSTTA